MSTILELVVLPEVYNNASPGIILDGGVVHMIRDSHYQTLDAMSYVPGGRWKVGYWDRLISEDEGVIKTEETLSDGTLEIKTIRCNKHSAPIVILKMHIVPSGEDGYPVHRIDTSARHSLCAFQTSHTKVTIYSLKTGEVVTTIEVPLDHSVEYVHQERESFHVILCAKDRRYKVLTDTIRDTGLTREEGVEDFFFFLNDKMHQCSLEGVRREGRTLLPWPEEIRGIIDSGGNGYMELEVMKEPFGRRIGLYQII